MKDAIVIGGGIVGLATALRLKKERPALRVLVLEKEKNVAQHQTGHNSGVIHSGLYYKPGSLKASNCLRGYRMLLDFCDAQEIPYELCGKIVVATRPEQVPVLNGLHERGLQNGLVNNRKVSPGEMREIEPHVRGLAGIWVPYTGIIDYKKVAETYALRLREMGSDIRFGEKVVGVKKTEGRTLVTTEKGGEYKARLIINCAGLYSDKMAQLTQDEPVKVRIIPFRGEYFQLKPEKEYLVKNLIYPVPDPNFPFLGVHFTRMIEGGVEAGPNAVLAFRREGYAKTDFDFQETGETLGWPGFRKVARTYWRTGLGEMYRSFSKAAFARALRELIPDIQSSDLVPGGAGVRAQACDYDGGLLDDFAILENDNAINVVNAPSPAATSSLSIGQSVAERALARL